MKGKITITRTQNNREDPRIIHIQIEDGSSSARIIDLVMTPEDFGNAITGLVMQECEYQLTNADKVGKVREVKTEIVPVPVDWFIRGSGAPPALLKPYEVDGWLGRAEDLTNSHNRTGNGGYRVVFVRYVDAEEGQA
jgi:hypothetical protein